MDDDLQLLEAELKRLRPAAPSRELVARIERDLARPAPAARPAASLTWLWAGALPAAAALAVVLATIMRRDVSRPMVPPPGAVAEASADMLKPVAAENVLYAARDEGVVVLDDGTAARRERRNYVDTITWKNPRTNASLKWSVPREEIRVVPVSFQ